MCCKKNRNIKMTNEGIWKELEQSEKLKECKAEVKRQKRFIEKQSDIILALEKDIELKDNIIIVLKNKKKK
tara:strand:+ start:337 stop:549 length:213 start_codon:yes stop_codon:yes gene_type:complete